VKTGVIMVGDGTNDNTANGPEHLQHLGSRGSQLDGYDLAAVCRCVGDEDTPWQALEQLGHEDKGKRVGKVKDEDEEVQKHQAGQGCPTVSNSVGKGACDTDANQRTELPRYLKRRLPFGLDDKFAGGGVPYSVFICECRQGDEIPNEEHIVGLHDLRIWC